MQTNIRHVCQADSARLLLESLFGSTITVIADNCTLGSLTDVDGSSPDQRIAFCRDLFSLAYGEKPTGWHDFIAFISN